MREQTLEYAVSVLKGEEVRGILSGLVRVDGISDFASRRGAVLCADERGRYATAAKNRNGIASGIRNAGAPDAVHEEIHTRAFFGAHESGKRSIFS